MLQLAPDAAAIAVIGIAVITELQSGIDDTVAAAAGGTVRTAGCIGDDGVFGSIVTGFARIDASISAELRQQYDERGGHALSLNAHLGGQTVGMRRAGENADASAIFADAGAALAVAGAGIAGTALTNGARRTIQRIAAPEERC